MWTDADASRGRGAGTPKANGAPRGEEGRGRLPPATVLQKQKSAVTVVTVTVLTAFQSPSRTESGGDSLPASTRTARKAAKAFSLRRKVMSLMNLKLHKGRERVRERINDGESPPFFILYLLI